MLASPDLPDVYSAREIARAAGVRTRDVRRLVAAGLIQPVAGTFFDQTDAIFAVRSLAQPSPSARQAEDRALFRPAVGLRREPALPLALTGTLHAAMLAGLVLMTTFGMARPSAVTPSDKAMHLVF